MVGTELLNGQFSFVETQPEILVDSGPGWWEGEGGEEELISLAHTAGSPHVTGHPVWTAVSLVSTAGRTTVRTTTNTCTWRQP